MFYYEYKYFYNVILKNANIPSGISFINEMIWKAMFS